MFAQNPDGSVAFARYATDGILSGGKITRGAKDVQVKTTGNLKFPTLPKLRLNDDETWSEVIRRKNRTDPGSGDALQAETKEYTFSNPALAHSRGLRDGSCFGAADNSRQ